MTNRALPPNVNAVIDRHGRVRYRYRRVGVRGGYLPGKPWSPPWLEALAAYQAQEAVPRAVVSATRARPYSMDDLTARLRGTLRWQRQADTTRRVYDRIIDRLLDETNKRGVRFGDRDARQITVASIERMLGRMTDRPGAASKRRKILCRLFSTANKLGWRADNPAKLTDAIPQVGEGFHTWTDAEIEQYRACHGYGTMARLALELALNTAARRCNLATIERSQISGGLIAIQHAKGGEDTSVEIMPETRLAIDAMPAAHIRYLIVTSFGAPFTVNGLGNRFRSWADEAGLAGCTLHGLRKAQARRLAEAGATNAEGRAVTGHKTDAMFNHYAQKANRTRLAGSAIAKLTNHSSPDLDQPK